MILSGYVPTPVPGPTEVPTRVPGPVVVATRVPGPAVVETEIPGPVIVPTPVPGPTIVATPMPFWLRQITGIIQAEGEIQVQVLGVTLDSSEAMTVRGQGLLSAVLSSMDLAPADQFLRGQAAIWAVVAGDREVEYPVHLEGRGEILASGVAMVMSAGVRALAGRGAVTAGGISTALQALVNLRGQGRVTASPTAMSLTDPVARLLAGRGAIQVSAGYPAMSPEVSTYTTPGTSTYTLPYWWRYLDIVMIGGGASGQTGSGATNTAGKGGNASSWTTVTLERGVDVPSMATSLTVVVGDGGAQAANSDLASPNSGEDSSVSGTGMTTVTSPGGSGTTSTQNGVSPGNVTYQTVTRTGGSAGTGSGGAATAPGASGAGGNGGIFGSRTRGGAGARGEVVLRVRQ